MFNKKALFAALLLVGTAGGLVGCGDAADEFEQNTNDFQAPEETMYVVGSHWNGWEPSTIESAEGCKFTRSAEDPNVYEIDLAVTQEMIDAWCGFKFIAGPSWGTQFGMEDVNWASSNDAFKNLYKNDDGSVKDKYSWHEGTTNRSNVEAKVPGTFHIEYSPFNFESETTELTTYSSKFVIEFTAA